MGQWLAVKSSDVPFSHESRYQFLNGLTMKILFFKCLHYKNPNRITGNSHYSNTYPAKKDHTLLYYINITRCFLAQNTFPSSYYAISSKHSFSWSAGQMSQLAEDGLHVTYNQFKFHHQVTYLTTKETPQMKQEISIINFPSKAFFMLLKEVKSSGQSLWCLLILHL